VFERCDEVDALVIAESMCVDHVTDFCRKLHEGKDSVLGKLLGDGFGFALLLSVR
jgi:hypothetical protein